MSDPEKKYFNKEDFQTYLQQFLERYSNDEKVFFIDVLGLTRGTAFALLRGNQTFLDIFELSEEQFKKIRDVGSTRYQECLQARQIWEENKVKIVERFMTLKNFFEQLGTLDPKIFFEESLQLDRVIVRIFMRNNVHPLRALTMGKEEFCDFESGFRNKYKEYYDIFNSARNIWLHENFPELLSFPEVENSQDDQLD